MKKLLFLFLLFSSSLSFAGSADAILECKSASGRTIFKAALQDLIGFTSATFTIDGESIHYKNSEFGHLVFNAKNKILTLSISDPKLGFLTFYAIPTTFKSLKKKNYEKHYKFEAIIQGLDPRKNKHQSKEIKLYCELTYSI